MLIRVMFRNGKFDMVKPHILNNLLEENIVTSFMRSDGWAVVGRDSLRKIRQPDKYSGPERRTH